MANRPITTIHRQVLNLPILGGLVSIDCSIRSPTLRQLSIIYIKPYSTSVPQCLCGTLALKPCFSIVCTIGASTSHIGSFVAIWDIEFFSPLIYRV